MKFQMSREKFETLEADAKHSGVIKDLHENDEYSGTITTTDVTLSYNYDAARQELNLEVGARHSLAAHMASDNIIYNHIVKALSNLAAAPLQAPPPVTSGTLQTQTQTGVNNAQSVNKFAPKPLVPVPVKTLEPAKEKTEPVNQQAEQVKTDIHVPENKENPAA